MPTCKFVKDPSDVLDYGMDWSAWLGVDTIATSVWTVEAGITEDSETETATTTTIWVSGGTADTEYTLSNLITTAGARTCERSIIIQVEDR
jgi:hypothetical protein